MLRSMYSGISGMKNFQTKLDVIGNNIANVNTYGFKKGRATFQDLLSQSVKPAIAPDTRGGVNPSQIGLGVTLGSIDTIDTQGSMQTTNRTLDLAISGDGYFIVNDGTNDYYTRAGNFYLDEAGDIVNSNGYTLKGSANLNVPSDAQSFSISETGELSYIPSTGGAAVPVGDIHLAKFANPGGLEKMGNNLYRETVNSGTPTTTNKPGTGGTGELISGALEMSNVDLSEEMTEMIIAQRAFQSNTKMITTSDEILQELINLKR